MFVDKVEEGSANGGRLCAGDVMLEIESKPITSKQILSIYFHDKSELFVQRGC